MIIVIFNYVPNPKKKNHLPFPKKKKLNHLPHKE